MTHQLWRFFLEDDVESFKRSLASLGQRSAPSKSPVATRSGTSIGSPTSKALSASPTQTRKSQGTPNKGRAGHHNTLSRAGLNARDYQGLNLLHWIASSYSEDAPHFALALLEQPLVDLSAQDAESAWTALHRALYFGNITVARTLLHRDFLSIGGIGGATGAQAGSLIKIKDNEGNSPFDLYNSSIAPRVLSNPHQELTISAPENDDVEFGSSDDLGPVPVSQITNLQGDELFMFGSNKNLNLGVGDEDDRQFPERITLKRPKHLLQHLQLKHMSSSLSRKNRHSANESVNQSLDLGGDPPALVQFSPAIVKDVQLSKLHTAVLTNDPEANLYMCGFGPGGRLGTGDESTRFSFTCIHSGGIQGRKVELVGLGQNHTLAVTTGGDVFSWGSNGFGQLGYSLSAAKDEEPVQLLPRQIYGPLKRETIVGCAASRIHSVVFTSETLYTFGKNEGQLGLIDSDARSLDIQVTPRAVAASLFPVPIVQATAIDKATACLLENHDVWIFANYGYTKVRFPLDDFTNFFLKGTYATTRYGDEGPNCVTKICSGGDTICALAREGQVFTLKISQSAEPSGKASTTNPTKIRNALSEPQKIWSLRKDSMACADVSVGQDGSIIICTKSGSVWRRTSRVKVKDSNSIATKGKDYKFSRVPGLTRVAAVRSNAFGSFAAIRQDWNVLQNQAYVARPRLWQDMYNLCPFKELQPVQPEDRIEIPVDDSVGLDVRNIRRAVLESKDVEALLQEVLENLDTQGYDMTVGSTVSDIRIPCHLFLLTGRSSILRHGMTVLRESYLYTISETATIEYDDQGKPAVLFQGLDILTLVNLVLYMYTDCFVDVWNFTRHAPAMTVRYKQVRIELQKAAETLQLKDLERAARIQVHPGKTLNRDLEQAYIAPEYFEFADIEIELDGTSYHGHRAVLVQRCPFFEGMFAGHSGGGWLRSRYERIEQEPEKLLTVDLQHIEPHVFDLVLRFLYADTGPELFDEVVTSDLDSFLDIVIEVMSVANELMIDRLAEVCQNVLGRYANIRNICHLLNAVAPCSVDGFKRAGLEYICLNLEVMLENHFLDELDEDLMLELDQTVRDNQNAYFSLTRRGEMAMEALLESNADLAERLDFARRRKIDSMRLHAKRLQREEEDKFANASKSPKLAPKSPKLSGKASAHDLLFEMDDEGGRSPLFKPVKDQDRRLSRLLLSENADSLPEDSPWLENRGKSAASVSPGPNFGSLNEMAAPTSMPTDSSHVIDPTAPSKSGAPWASTSLRSEKLDLKSIMAQADERRSSSVFAGLTANPAAAGKFKMSQKERRKQVQDEQKRRSELEAEVQQGQVDSAGKQSAWQPVSSGSKVSLKNVLGKDKEASSPASHPQRAQPSKQSGPSLTMRQTIPGNAAPGKSNKTTQPTSNTPRAPGRSVSSPQVASRAFSSPVSTKVTTAPRPPSPKPAESRPHPVPIMSSPAAPRSVRHIQPAEPSLQLSMADILAQQQLEKEVIKDAVAKRSLQEIQAEQEFQEWWDAEEKATRARIEAEGKTTPGSGSKRGGRSRRGRGAASNDADGSAGASTSTRNKSSGRGRGGKSRGGGAADGDRTTRRTQGQPQTGSARS